MGGVAPAVNMGAAGIYRGGVWFGPGRFFFTANEVLRLVITAAGHFIMDKPEGEGGIIAISGANVATIDDFASKSWAGISFPDDRPPELVSATTGALDVGRVPFTSIILEDTGDITPQATVYLNNGATGSKLSEALDEPGDAYTTNQIVIGGDYTGGAPTLPGIFELDPVSGDETAIIAIGATVGGKTILFGSVVNEVEFQTNGVKGNFFLFEK